MACACCAHEERVSTGPHTRGVAAPAGHITHASGCRVMGSHRTDPPSASSRTPGTRSVTLGSAVRYRGPAGMWTWMLHRVTGLGILCFLIIHVLETAVVVYSPGLYDHALTLYRSPMFRMAELVIFFSVLYHAINGLRITIQDFWPYLMRWQRHLLRATAVIVGLAMIPVTWMMVAPLLGLTDEPGAARHEQRCRRTPEASACRRMPGAEKRQPMPARTNPTRSGRLEEPLDL